MYNTTMDFHSPDDGLLLQGRQKRIIPSGAIHHLGDFRRLPELADSRFELKNMIFFSFETSLFLRQPLRKFASQTQGIPPKPSSAKFCSIFCILQFLIPRLLFSYLQAYFKY